MGTHPIFESDFDCLIELIRENKHNGNRLEFNPVARAPTRRRAREPIRSGAHVDQSNCATRRLTGRHGCQDKSAEPIKIGAKEMVNNAMDPRAAPGSVLPTESNDLKWSPENKHAQRLYISTLLEKLEYLVENWSEESGGGGGGAASGGGNGGGGQKEPNMKAVLFPTRRTEDIGRLNSHT